MENFVVSLELIFPICLYMVLGFVLRRALKLKEDSLWQMNKLVYSVFLPLFLFSSIYSSDFSENFDLNVLIFGISSVIILFIALFLIIPKIEKERSNQSVMIQGIYRSNYALYGMAMTALLFGENRTGMAGVLAAIIIPIFSFLAVFLFEMYRGEKISVKSFLKNIVKNPLIIACVAGIIFVLLKIEIPKFVMKPINSLGQIATPLALIVLGAIFSVDNVKKYWRQLLKVVVGKLIIVPLIFIFIAFLLGIRGVNLYVLLTLYASPTAVASFSMATAMGGKKELAGLIVAITSVVSVVTFFFWTFLLKQLGWV